MKGFRLVVVAVVLSAAIAGVQTQETFNKQEFAARRAKLLDQIGDGIAVVIGGDEPGAAPVKFRQLPTFYYLTGIEEPNAVAIFNGVTRRTYIFAPKKSENEIRFEGPGILDTQNSRDFYGVTDVLPLDQLTAMLALPLPPDAKRLYLQMNLEDNLQQSRFEVKAGEVRRTAHPLYRNVSAMRMMLDNVRRQVPQLQVADLGPIMDKLRWIKSPYEIERMRKAGSIGAESVKEAIKGTHAGQYEYEVEATARYITTKAGAGMGFTPIVASGPNTMAMHYEANTRRMQAGDVVLLDVGADYDYYVSDVTRTWPVGGRFSAEQEKMYACILAARNAIIGMMKPGVTIQQMKNTALQIYKRHGFEREFEESGRYVGHYVGMSVHDVSPGPDAPLQAGTTYNVEPMLTLEVSKIHMRLEDSVLVTERGAENLTKDAPAELEEIYALIRQKGLAQAP